jgi:hypothetical protein
MRKLLLGAILLFSTLGFSQRQISYDTISKYSVNHLKLKGSIVYDEYLSKDNFLYKVGDTIKINKPVNGDKFSFISDRFTQVQSNSTIIGSEMIIKNIIVIGFRDTGYELCITITNKYNQLSLKLENAISSGEINSSIITSDNALDKLKKAKEKLDLDLITQEEYDNLKKELKKYIK